MRVGIQTWGSEGDVRPLIASGHGLHRAGHQVCLAYTSVEGRNWVPIGHSLGIEIVDIGRDLVAANRLAHADRLDGILHVLNPLRQLKLVTELFVDPLAEELYQSALAMCASCDVVVAHFLSHPLIAAAKKTSTPLVIVFTAPVTPSRHYLPIGSFDAGFLNPWIWTLFAKLIGPYMLESPNRLRAQHGIPPLKCLFDGLDEPLLMLTSVSTTLFPRPDDWPQNHLVCGSLTLPAEDQAEPFPEDLKAFLAAGEPPIFMTFGSMLGVTSDEARLGSQLLVQAALLLNRRAIIQAPWDQLPDTPVPERIHKLIRIEHSSIFPLCDLVVHHGGAGTTHSASRAGCPSVVVPYIADQTFWAGRLRRLGIAMKSTKRTAQTPERLANQIEAALASFEMTAFAMAIEARMQMEDGVVKAVHGIEVAMKSIQSSQRKVH